MLQSTYDTDTNRLLDAWTDYYEFLVESPLDNQTTLHQHYRISGRLVAVGVLDVLPHGVSSVYLYYDPTFPLALGQYAILKEIEWTQTERKLPYYYLGYYIDSCPKMKYKAEYAPSELLCPVTYEWVDALVAQRLLRDAAPQCCKLSQAPLEESTANETSPQQDHAVDTIRLWVDHGPPVTVPQLDASSQSLIRPLLQDLVDTMGVEAVQHVTVDLR